MGYQYSSAETSPEAVLTHLDALQRHNSFELTAAVDLNEELCNRFELKHGIKTFNSVSSIPESLQFDLVVVSTPTSSHSEVLAEIVKKSPKLILMEKPLGASHHEAIEIEQTLSTSSSVLAVNFQRSFSKTITSLAARIKSRDLIGPFHMQCQYTGTLLNNGSHLVSLIQTLFPTEYKLISKDNQGTCSLFSAEYEARINLERVQNFSGNIFRFTLLSREGELVYDSTANLISKRDLVPQENYENELTLSREILESAIGEEKALLDVYDVLSDFLKYGKPIPTNLEHGIQNNFLIDQMIKGD